MTETQIRDLARLGAGFRMSAIVIEMHELIQQFPELGLEFEQQMRVGRVGPPVVPATAAAIIDELHEHAPRTTRRRKTKTKTKRGRRQHATAADQPTKRKPRFWSAAARKATSARMKKYWAERREAAA